MGALGGKSGGIMRWKDLPGSAVKPESADKVMHGELLINDSTLYFGDSISGAGVTGGEQVEICIECDSEDQIKNFFNALKVNAKKVNMELYDTFWGSKFGSLVDRYGIGRSFNFQIAKRKGL